MRSHRFVLWKTRAMLTMCWERERIHISLSTPVWPICAVGFYNDWHISHRQPAPHPIADDGTRWDGTGWSRAAVVFLLSPVSTWVLSLFLVLCVGVEVLNQTQHDGGGGGQMCSWRCMKESTPSQQSTACRTLSTVTLLLAHTHPQKFSLFSCVYSRIF